MLAENFSNLAKSLENNKQSLAVCDDALRRTCIGRYYYHVFHIVKEWLSVQYHEVWLKFMGKTHEQLRLCCEALSLDLGNRDFEKLGLKLKMLHDLRVRADYKLNDKVSEGDLTTVKIEKDRVLELVYKLKQLKQQTNKV
ncbi:MAG: hypothetical protein WA154_02790 [Moraxellaceae bacterium]